MEVYDEICVLNEFSLNQNFANRFKNELIKGSRGYGFWCWKPQIVLQMFDRMEMGDVLQYTDSGCHLNRKGVKRLVEYFELAKNSKGGLLSFRTKNISELQEGETFHENTERRYTKADVLAFFDVLGNDSILDSPQYEGGIFFIRKDPNNIDFIKQWINIFSTNFNLINDAASQIANDEKFVDHRHDQSLYSLLCKRREVEELYTSEYFIEDSDWNKLSEYPIWVKRDKAFSLSAKLIMFPKRVFNYLKRRLRG